MRKTKPWRESATARTFRPLPDGQRLRVRKDNVIFEIQVFHALGGDTPVVQDPQQNLKALNPARVWTTARPTEP